MAKITLADVSNILGNPTSAANTLNNNNTTIETAFENTLSRDGTTPNQMEADIDLNGRDLLNVESTYTNKLYLEGDRIVPADAVNAGNFQEHSANLDVLSDVVPGDTGLELLAADTPEEAGAILQLYVSSPQVSIEAFGASLSGTQTPAIRRAAIQTTIDYASPLGLSVFIPAGTWVIDSTLIWRPNTSIVGAGIDLSVIQFSTTAGENLNMMQPEAFDMSVGNVYVAHLHLDGNRAARVTAGTVTGVGNQRPGSSGIATMSAHDCVFYKVKSSGQVLHSFDNCAGGDINPVTLRRDYVYPFTPSGLSTTPSRNNIYIECIADDWGDDGFTAHYDEYCTFLRCRALAASDYYTANLDGTNGFEFDDGSYGGKAIDCYASYSASGFAAKGHNDGPAASGGAFVRCFAQYCNTGVTVYGDTNAGIHHDWSVVDCKVRNPRNRPGGDGIMQGARFANYINLTVDGLDIEADSYGMATTLDYGILVSLACKDVRMERVRIVNWPGDSITSTAALRVTPDSEVTFEGEILEPGIYGIHWTGGIVSPRDIKARIVQTAVIAGSKGIYMTTRPTRGIIAASIEGFELNVDLTSLSYTDTEVLLQEGYQVQKAVSTTATWDPASLASGASQTTTVALSGSVVGDPVQVSFSLDLAGTVMTGYVSTAGTVTVVHSNLTGGAVNLGSGTLTITSLRS